MYLEMINLSKGYQDKLAVDQLSLTLEKGELLCLLGPSGCGKTTTLRMAGGFVTADSGTIRVDGQDITALSPEKRPVATVFQSYALFPHLNVLENVIYGLKYQGYSRKEASNLGHRYLELVSLSDYRNSKIHELSGGQQQRVALARALIIGPKLLLLDEPLSNLDAELRIRLRQEIKSIQKELDMTMVFVTHDQEEAMAIGDRLALMHEGKLVQLGTPEEIYNHPKDLFSLNFMGKANTLIDRHGQSFHVRPEHLTVADDGELEGIVLCKTFLGFYSSYTVRCQKQDITITLPWGHPELKQGQHVRLKILQKIVV